ncbi:MAG TPA: hypothetical protein VKP59_03435, partial [Candidatus Thermoplasmatota archaeon]|nr:hypothetical protein [Candidatus Thermoplasmatota archaeon]
TVAVEVPVWYWEKRVGDGVTGHIDLLQIRNDMVYILDYKPKAAKEKKGYWSIVSLRVSVIISCTTSIESDSLCVV